MGEGIAILNELLLYDHLYAASRDPALTGELVARFYSEPMNRLLRTYWEEGPNRLGSVIDADSAAA